MADTKQNVQSDLYEYISELNEFKDRGFALADRVGALEMFSCPTIIPSLETLPALSFKFDGHGENIQYNKNSIYFVTNLNSSGPGSLLEAPANSYVVFAGLFGDINLPDASIRNIADDQWVMGQTGNIQIRHAAGTQNAQALWAICTKGGAYQYLRFRPGESLGPTQNAHGPFTILGTSSPNSAYQNGENNVLSHCSLQFGDDDSGETWFGSKGFTLADTLISHPLDFTNPEYGPNMGGGSSDFTMVRCLESGIYGRSPLLQNFQGGDICNNLLWGGDGLPTLQAFAGGVSSANIRGNVTLSGNNGRVGSGAIIRTDTGGGTNTFYDDDNWALDSQGADPSNAAISDFVPAPAHGPSSPLAVPQGTALTSPLPCPVYTMLDPRNGLIAHVLNNVGVSHSRDALDLQAINWVRNQTDTPLGVTNIAAYGGHPVMAPITQTDIWDPSQVDGLKSSIKVSYGLGPNENTFQTFSNGGTSNDFLAIFSQFYPL